MDGQSANTQAGGASPAIGGIGGEAVAGIEGDTVVVEERANTIFLGEKDETAATEPAGSEPTGSEPTGLEPAESEPTGSDATEQTSPAGAEVGAPSDTDAPESSSDSAAEPKAAPAPTAAPAATKTPPTWPRGMLAAASAFYEWLGRPRVRLAGTGVLLLFVGGLVLTNSVWTLPLVLIGSVMVVIAWIGPRLDGRFAVEWGHAGTQLAFRAKIRAAEPHRSHLLQSSSTSHELVRTYTHPPDPPKPEIVDGHAETVEIDVAALKALITAVESRDPDLTAVKRRDTVVSRGTGGEGETASVKRPAEEDADLTGGEDGDAAAEDRDSAVAGTESDGASSGDAFVLGHRTLRVAYGDQRASEAS
jgi:hypothetical protein